MDDSIRLYPRSITITNIKTIEHMHYAFPEIKFDLDGKPVITKGILLTGSNFIGKTTFLQCINTSLKNDIGDLLIPEEALRDGCNTGVIDFELIDQHGESYRITHDYVREDEVGKEGVVCKWQFTRKTSVLKSYQTGAIGKLKNFLGYHYISPNEIMLQSATVPGRRKLMKHFLNSVPNVVRDTYMEWDALELKHFDIRTEKHVSLMKIETIQESFRLTPIEKELLTRAEILKEAVDAAQLILDNKTKEVTLYEDKYDKIYAPEDFEASSETFDEYAIQKPIWFSTTKAYNQEQLRKENEKLQLKIAESEGLEGKFKPLKSRLATISLGASLATYTSLLDNLKTLYQDLLNLDTTVSTEITRMNGNITVYNTAIEDAETARLSATVELNKALAELPDEKPTIVSETEKLNAATLAYDAVKLIVEKNSNYIKYTLEQGTAYEIWKVEDDKVVEARDEKKKIIEENDIEVEGFEFSPDGVTLNEHKFAERNVSGAERRIAACQFTMAMNSTVMIGVLEEMESLDSGQEQRIFRFAADRGFVVLSDNVTKEVITTVQIESVNIL